METTPIWSHLLSYKPVNIYVRTSANFILRCNIPENIYLFKINNRTLEKVIKQKRQNDYWNRYGDFIGDFELIYIFLVFFLLNLNRFVFVRIFQLF